MLAGVALLLGSSLQAQVAFPDQQKEQVFQHRMQLFYGQPDAEVSSRQLFSTDSASFLLPAGEWYDFHTGKRQQGGTRQQAAPEGQGLSLFVKAGTLLPLVPYRLGRGPYDPLELRIYPDGDKDLRFHLQLPQPDGSLIELPLRWKGRRKEVVVGPASKPLKLQVNVVLVEPGMGIGWYEYKDPSYILLYEGRKASYSFLDGRKR